MQNDLTRLTHYADISLDSHRWGQLPLRADDIIVAAPPKSGTTWLQTISALLVFQSADLPAGLSALSPWLDSNDTPIADVVARLEAQQHRRIIKSHTPADGIPTVPGMTVIAGARNPLDTGV